MSDRPNPWRSDRPDSEPGGDRFWSELVDGIGDAVIVYDAALRYIALNRAAAEIYGYSSSELVGRSRDEVVGIDEHTPRLREALCGDAPTVLINEVDTPAGRRTYETVYQPYRAEGGKLYLVGIARKISGARERREHGDASPPTLSLPSSTHAPATPVAAIRFDDNWRIVSWSKGAEELFGWSAAEAAGRTPSELQLALPSERDTVPTRMLGAPFGAQIVVRQRSIDKDGAGVECMWTSARMSPDDGGGYFCTVQVAADEEPAPVALPSAEEQRFRSLFENSPDGIVSVNREGIVTDINAAALAIVGARRSEIVGHPIASFFDGADMPPILAAFERTLAGAAQTVEVRPRTRPGEYADLECTASPIFCSGKVVGVHVVLKDISARKRAERALQLQHERIRDLYLCATASNVPSEEQVRRTLELGCRMLGMELALIYDAQGGGTTTLTLDLRDPGADPAVRISEPLARAAMAAPDGLVIDDPAAPELTRPDDPTLLAAFIGAPIDVGGESFGALCFASSARRPAPFGPADRDLVQLISVLIGAEIERRRARLHLRTLAYYDSLTNLPNRVLLKERLEAALTTGAQSGVKTAVLFLDLDRFKDINDTIGHVLGDRLLQVAGERIVGCVRSTETVARMGGDEFIVVMPAIAEAGEAVALAERLLKAIDAPFSIAGHERYTTTSIGIAIAPTDGSDSDTLIKNADIAMYRAKDRGRNTFALFTPEFDRTTSLRVANEQGMRRALDRGEFRTFYQPIVDVRGGRVYCVEALARWQHPALSVLRPDAFITSAETSGLIVRLGEIVLEDACRQVRAWHGAGFTDLMLSVNLSARQFRETQLLETLATILGRTGFPPHLLQLEITEGVAMTDPEMNVGIMRELKGMGIRMIVDDFGTGYSSLGYLRRFPLDGLKIDRSFVAGIGHERDDETIVRTVIGMAHSLGLLVVAEGVETAEQVEFLRCENCEMAQGHFYSPALPAAGCERYLRAWADLVNAG